MEFNTAIFYDIENLIGGYGTSKSDMPDFSLREIVKQVRELEIVKEIAIQRAYADWSNPRLHFLRHSMVDLGIEPIQMFGFGRGGVKNASDIQLAIDAVEIAIRRSSLETFVVISGDGGFSTLAKKLHEYGRAVVGCSLSGSINPIFKAVCDHFITIPLEPKKTTEDVGKKTGKAGKSEKTASEAGKKSEGDSPTSTSETAASTVIPAKKETAKRVSATVKKDSGIVKELTKANGKKLTDPVLIDFLSKRKKLKEKEGEDELSKVKRVVKQFVSYLDREDLWGKKGIGMSAFVQLVSYLFPDISFRKSGFARSIDFMGYLLKGAGRQMIFKAPSDFRMLGSGIAVEGYEVIHYNFVPTECHSEEHYRAVLKHDSFPMNLPKPEVLAQVLSLLLDLEDDAWDCSFEDLVVRLQKGCPYEEQEVKNAVYSFYSSGAFECTPKDGRLHEKKLRLQSASGEELLAGLKKELCDRITTLLDTCADSVVELLLPSFTSLHVDDTSDSEVQSQELPLPPLGGDYTSEATEEGIAESSSETLASDTVEKRSFWRLF